MVTLFVAVCLAVVATANAVSVWLLRRAIARLEGKVAELQRRLPPDSSV